MDYSVILMNMINNMFMHRMEGKTFNEDEYLYYLSCLSLQTQINKFKEYCLELDIGKLRDGNYDPTNRNSSFKPERQEEQEDCGGEEKSPV